MLKTRWEDDEIIDNVDELELENGVELFVNADHSISDRLEPLISLGISLGRPVWVELWNTR